MGRSQSNNFPSVCHRDRFLSPRLKRDRNQGEAAQAQNRENLIW